VLTMGQCNGRCGKWCTCGKTWQVLERRRKFHIIATSYVHLFRLVAAVTGMVLAILWAIEGA